MTLRPNIARLTYRYGRPSFLRGFAGTLDLFGTLAPSTNLYLSSPKDDADAIAEDWKMVGQDLRDAFDRAGCKQ